MKKYSIIFSCIIGIWVLVHIQESLFGPSTSYYGTAHTVCYNDQPPIRLDNLYVSSIQLLPPEPIVYPWKNYHAAFSPITKEYFRCRGSSIHPPIPVLQDGKTVSNLFDCGGSITHSLPIRNGKEFIYPILIELLNHIQRLLKKEVVITSGHRCPTHNTYINSSPKNQFSKHLIGAEARFYIKGLDRPTESVVTCIEDFYRSTPKYSSSLKEYVPLSRYEKETDTSTKPWMNKEIFLKYYLSHEGRDGENRHSLSYFSLQVRFDRERNISISVNPQECQSYLRF